MAVDEVDDGTGPVTVFVDGNLFRIAGVDADAIGREPVLPPTLPEDATEEDEEEGQSSRT